MGLKFVDLFCGIGTIRMGMEQAGHECVYSVEWDKHKRKIYSIIFGKEPEGSDIRATNARDIPRADVWTFGAPCQDFSIAGTRSGLEGDRSSLIREVFRLVRETKEEHRPKYLLYENVKGMLSSNKGFDYLEILSEMESLGYDIEWQLLNSKNFGVPQNRERVFTLGCLRGRSARKVFPIGGKNTITCTEVGTIEGIGGHDILKRCYSLDGLSPTLNICAGGNHFAKFLQPCVIDHNKVRITEDRSMCVMASYYKGLDNHGARTAILQTGRGYNKGGEHEITPTLTKNSWQHNNHLVTDYGIRRLTPKECWRLQGISDEISDKVIQAGISDTQMYRGAGDACTVNVIYEIAKKLT